MYKKKEKLNKLFKNNLEKVGEGAVPYTITGNGVGHKKASDIIKSPKIKKQLETPLK